VAEAAEMFVELKKTVRKTKIMIKPKRQGEILQKGFVYSDKNQKIRKYDLLKIFEEYNISTVKKGKSDFVTLDGLLECIIQKQINPKQASFSENIILQKVAVSLLSDFAKDRVRSSLNRNKKAYKSFLNGENVSQNSPSN
jgi:hypothetical protein